MVGEVVGVKALEVASGEVVTEVQPERVGEPDTLNDTVRDGVGVKVLDEDVVTVPQLDGVMERDTLGVPDIVPDKVIVVEWVTEEHTEGDKLGVADPETAFDVATGDTDPDVHTV